MTVTIIGAGIVGCAIAYELASRGAHVHVLDGRGVGLGATRASAGILAPRIEGHSDALLRLAACGLNGYDDFMSRVRRDSPVPVEYERRGTLQVARSAEEAALLRAQSARLAALGVTHTLLGTDDLLRLEPALSRSAAAGLLLPDDGYVVPDGFACALADAASKRGARFVTARAIAVHGGERHAEVVTESGTIESEAAIVAGGSWSSDVADSRTAPVKPIRGQLLHLRTERRLASRVLWGMRCYIVPRADYSVLVGATVEDVGFDERATVSGIRELLDASMELLPGLETATFSEARVGLRPMTRDELPAIGAARTPRVFYAIGHYRNGVLLAPLTAVMLADLVLEGREHPELALTRPARLGL